MYITQQQRRDTAANWTINNPILFAGEIGHETDTGKSKIGDGVTHWTSLGYWNPTAIIPLLNDRGAIAASTAYNPGDMVAYRGQRVLITTAVTSSTWPNWFTPPTLTPGTYIPITSNALYYAADWGVVTDGVTDNGPALNRALQFMSKGVNSGGFLILPDGYSPGGQVVGVSSTVIIPPGCFIVGSGIETSCIRLNANANCDVIQFQTFNSTSQAAIISAAEGNTVNAGSLRNAFYSGLMNLTIHGANSSQAATSYNYGVNMTTNPISSTTGTDPDFDPSNFLFNVEIRSCTGDGLFHNGRGQLRVTNLISRYNQGWGTVASPDSLYIGCNWGANGLGGFYTQHSAVDGAACKSYNNGKNAQWVSGSNYSALTPVMYNGVMYRSINALTNDTTPPSSDPTNWATVAATAPQFWGYGYVWTGQGENSWSAADAQENSAGDYYLQNMTGSCISGTSANPNWNQVTVLQNSTNPNNYAVLTLDNANGCIADIAYKGLNSAVYVVRVVNGSTSNDVRMTGDTTYEAIVSPDSIALVGSGNSVRVNGSVVSDSVAVAFATTGLTGATAASRYVGATVSGPPVTGTFAAGDFVIDQSGQIQLCVTGGSPGSWVTFVRRAVNTPAVQPSPGTAAYGTVGTAADTGHIHGQPPMFAPTGLTGATTASRYVGGTTGTGAPSSGTFAVGDYVVDTSGGNIFICTSAGSPGTWARLAQRNANAANIQPIGAVASAGSTFLAADAGHVHAGLSNLAATSAAGVALINGTQTILTWTAPSDGLLHRVSVFATIDVTSNETGGLLNVAWTAPDGTATAHTLLSAGSGTGVYNPGQSFSIMCKAGTTVSIQQASALTAGAATIWAEFWGL